MEQKTWFCQYFYLFIHYFQSINKAILNKNDGYIIHALLYGNFSFNLQQLTAYLMHQLNTPSNK